MMMTIINKKDNEDESTKTYLIPFCTITMKIKVYGETAPQKSWGKSLRLQITQNQIEYLIIIISKLKD